MDSGWKDHLVFGAILVGICGLVYFDTARDQQGKVVPGSAEHEAHIREMADNCMRESMLVDPDNEASLTYRSRLALCMHAAREGDRLYPGARPYRRNSN